MKKLLLMWSFLPMLALVSSSLFATKGSSCEAVLGGGSETARITYLLHDSKQFFTTSVREFKISLGGRVLECRSRAMYLNTPADLFDGWNPADMNHEKFAEADKQRGRSYIYTSCRNDQEEVIGWFNGTRREYESETTAELVDDKYDSAVRPLVLQAKHIESGAKSYWICDGARDKKFLRETATGMIYDVGINCRPAAEADIRGLGLLEFIDKPGLYGALVSYRGGMLPSVPSTQASLVKVAQGLFSHVPSGDYTGVMKTLSTTCELKTSLEDGTLVVEHTTTKGKARTRRLELKAENLLGYLEGDIFADPIRIEKKSVGRFAAAEFANPKKPGESVHVRFEKLTSIDGWIVRINGSELYCRRMKAK